MIRLLLIFLLPLILNASKILSYNIYDRTDRADVMITFDTPYEGSIKQSTSKSKIIIKLTDAEIESAKLKNLSSKFLYSINILPMSGYTQVVASVPESVNFQASKTSDSYGLRLRFSPKVATQNKKTSLQTNSNPLSNLPTKKDDEMARNYYIVIAILIIGILILFLIKKKATLVKNQTQQKSWLFKENQPAQPATQENIQNSVSIRFQKNIDSSNNVVMLDFADQSYLVLMGSSNILLDKFTGNKPATQEDFETILRDRHQELEEFLSVKEKPKEPLQAYKERAASISYEA
ncbi:hypothetical protein [Sulfurimonas sp.]|uniref:hypothetical protein n=1 Tax=Sulfurimonas sp. TaxID=2022749 RepID=UPI003566BF42